MNSTKDVVYNLFLGYVLLVVWFDLPEIYRFYYCSALVPYSAIGIYLYYRVRSLVWVPTIFTFGGLCYQDLVP